MLHCTDSKFNLYHTNEAGYMIILLFIVRIMFAFYLMFLSIKSIPYVNLDPYLSIVTANRFMMEATADKTREYSATLHAPPSISKSRAAY